LTRGDRVTWRVENTDAFDFSKGVLVMAGLARWCIHRKKLVLLSWITMLVALGGLVGVAGSAFSDSSQLPASDSATAYSLLARGGSDAAKVTTGTIVWDTRSGSALSPAVSSRIAPMLAGVAKVDGVKAVISPFTAAGARQVSADSRTAYATVVFTSDSHEAAAQKLARAAATSQLDVQVGGAAFTKISPGGVSEVIGVLAALMILILVFRSAWAAVLPIITGVAGVGVSSLAVILLSHVMTLPSVAPELGALIGLGVGIDYALFIVNRHRQALRHGADLPGAITTAMSTSGRAVLFAGGTVIVALLGLVILNVGFLTGMGIAAAVTVFLTVMAAVTLLPALLATMGRRVLRKSERATTGADPAPAGPGVWGRWARLVERRPVVAAVLAVAMLAALAAPALAIRLGAADDSSTPTGTSARSYYDTMANAFGPGFDAQLLLVAQTPDSQARAAWTTLTAELPEVKGIASAGTPAAVTGNSLSMIQVVPTTASQDQATSDLVHTLRSSLVPRAEAGTDLRVYVGGTTATNVDMANALTSKLPLFLVIIAVLGFLLLTLAFRSLLVPAIGAIGNLLTIAVALGSTVALFQWGWGQPLFGIGGPAPLEYTVAILIVGVVFGLSMDYHVFLVSRMHERWTQTGDNRRAVTSGAADTGGVIVTAAAIMACVFASFGLAGVRTISEFGVGLAVAVLADAFLLRMTLIPALMHLIGRRNWAIPSWLDRVLPRVSVDGPGPDRPHTAGQHRTPVAVDVP
jgi:putative drug exporter of the RND superfamily